MVAIKTSSQPIGVDYPSTTGRLKQVIGTSPAKATKVALIGDSTLDNGYWVQNDLPYPERTHTVTHQTAVELASNPESSSYEIGNFAVDGATTNALMNYFWLNSVVRDADHINKYVCQLDAVAKWGPDVAVLSVAGNNYREALQVTLRQQLSYPQLFFRTTPAAAKIKIKEDFDTVKETLLLQYKQIIDELIKLTPTLKRIVLLSQYYPSITEFTRYFIYTGFSHVARAEGKGQDAFTAVEETMNELYQQILEYAATKNKEIVFADVASSLNPLGGNHAYQIEPNEKGSRVMGELIGKAVEYRFPDLGVKQDKNHIALLRLSDDETHVQSKLLIDSDISNFRVKKIEQFISENRYRHLGLLFSPSSSLGFRYECAYHAIMGKQFDTEYKGLFAFGLLDLSLITVMASYLWRAAVNDELHMSLRITAGIIAAPVLLSKMIVGLSLMLVLALPIYAYHKLVNCSFGIGEIEAKSSQENVDYDVENNAVLN